MRQSRINWNELQRKAASAYEEEAKRRRKTGSYATEDAERLAHRAEKEEVDDFNAAWLLEDQTVYAYNQKTMVGHFLKSAIWSLVEHVSGMACEVYDYSPSQGHNVLIKRFDPGEWTWIGRGKPGAA